MTEENSTIVDDLESMIDQDSDDEDLNSEDKELRKEILRNFMASARNEVKRSGKHTNMKMITSEDQHLLISRNTTPIGTPIGW